MRMSSILISLVLVTFISISTFSLMGEMSTTANLNDYDEASIGFFNQSASLNAKLGTIQNKAQNTSVSANPFDLLGEYFTRGYAILSLSADSLSLFTNIAETAGEHAGLGDSTNLVTSTLISILMIIIFVGIITSALVKRNM